MTEKEWEDFIKMQEAADSTWLATLGTFDAGNILKVATRQSRGGNNGEYWHKAWILDKQAFWRSVCWQIINHSSDTQALVAAKQKMQEWGIDNLD